MSDLIDREALLNKINKFGVWALPMNRHVRAMYDCRDMIKNMPSAYPERQWIPCGERLPEDGKKRYWVCTDTGYQCECRWTNINHIWTDLTTDWHWHIMDIPQYSHVVAWMELPDPYKEEQDELH